MTAPALTAPERLDAAGMADMTDLPRIACGRYGVSPGFGLHLYPLTENWTYRIEPADAGPAVLRIYRPGGRSPAEIASALAWMRSLGEDVGSLVPSVLPTTAGSLVLELAREPPRPPATA